VLGLEDQVNSILDWITKRTSLEMEVKNINKILRNIKTNILESSRITESITTFKEIFDREMGEICILCGSKLENNGKNKNK
jgi:hypothetical protein